MIDQTIQEIEKLHPEERKHFLRLRTPEQLREILEEWAKTISLENYGSLRAADQCVIYDAMVGNPQKGLPPMGRVFKIEPVGGPVSFQVGSKYNRRIYKELKEPTTVPAQMAISALSQFGCLCKVDDQRGRIREYIEPQKKPRRKHRKKAAPVKEIEAAPGEP